MSHIVYYDYIAFLSNFFCFLGLIIAMVFFICLVFLSSFFSAYSGEYGKWLSMLMFQMLKFLRHLSHPFVSSCLSCGSYPDLLSFVSSLGLLQSCCLGIPLSFSLLGIDCFEEFPVLWVLVGGKASLSHLKLKMSDAQFSSPSYSQSSGTGINLSESDEPSIYLEPETWRDEDLEELFGSMIVAAKWLHSWLHHPGLFRVNGVSTYPH